MFSRARAMAAAGMVLSQPTIMTNASKEWPRATSSMESAITSRLTSDARIPSVPIETPSEMAMVLNSMGVPPAARTPAFTRSASWRWVKLQGMVSIQLWPTPMMGLARSSRLNPMARNMARAPARAGPSVMTALRRLAAPCPCSAMARIVRPVRYKFVSAALARPVTPQPRPATDGLRRRADMLLLLVLAVPTAYVDWRIVQVWSWPSAWSAGWLGLTLVAGGAGVGWLRGRGLVGAPGGGPPYWGPVLAGRAPLPLLPPPPAPI